MLYVVVTHRGGWAARGVRVDVEWARGRERSGVATRELGRLATGDSLRLEVDGLQKLLPPGDEAWEELVVRARGTFTLPARRRLPLARRSSQGGASSAGGGADAAPEPVRYARAADLPCPEAPDGRHAFEERPYMNDGVLERWRVCRLCRHVEREPLTPEQEETQRRIRRARAERQRREMEAEFARRAAEEEPQPRAQRPGAGRTWRHTRHEDELARDVDTFPPEVAFFVLELDPRSATWQDVLAAHRRLALAHHPDRHVGSAAPVRAAAERKMQEINGARDRLREHFGIRPAQE